MGAQQWRLGFYFSKSKEGTCHVERSPTGSGGGGVKEQRPTHGWVDRHMDIPLLLAKQVKDAAEGK